MALNGKLNSQKLVQLFEARAREGQPQQAVAELKEQFAAKAIVPAQIDLGQVFIDAFGWHNFNACRRRAKEYHTVLQENMGAVTTAAFTNISGQFMYTTVMDAYEMEETVFSALFPEKTASTLDGEKIPGITRIGDEIAVRLETAPYALAGVGEDWLLTPAIKDRGVIVPVTWEAVFNDKTGRLIEEASDVGAGAKTQKEKRAIDTAIDENLGTLGSNHRYCWRGVTIASYGDNSGSHTWDNLSATTTLIDWQSIDTVQQVHNAITDPFTGEPVPYEQRHLTVTKQLEQTARRILSATEIRVHTGGYATSGNLTQTNAPNPYNGKLELITSRLLAARMAIDTSWFLGDWTKYAVCMMAEPMNVMAAPPGNPDDFSRRIVQAFRVNERCEFVVTNPRSVVKATVA